MSTSRQPKGIPVGGQFAAGAHSEAEVALARPTFVEYEAPIVGTAKLNLGSFDVLPEWPTGMPEPSVTYDFNDGKVNTYIDIDDSGSVRSMRFWTDDIDGTYDSTDHGENPWEEFDDEDQEAARAYGKSVHERVDASTYGVMIEATGQGKVREIILAHATGAAPAEEPARRQPDAPDLEDEDARRDYISRARFQVDEANKAIQRAHMVGAAKELRDRHPGIASFDLSSHGDSPAIVNAWDEAGEPVADPVIDAANRDVFRWRILEDFNTLMYKDEPISVSESLAWRPA